MIDDKVNDKLTVFAPSKTYNIYFEKSFDRLGDIIVGSGLDGRKICVVTDSNVAPLYLNDVRNALRDISFEYYEFVFEAGEENKTLSTIADMYTAFLSFGLDRKSVIVALGGGVTGDMAGFAAATYMRGISFIQVPTTLLAQVDSGVGGKTGVDVGQNKNVVGAFYQPEFVYVNVTTLNTLPAVQFASGMAEAIKHGLIHDAGYFYNIAAEKDLILEHDTGALTRLVYQSCLIKAAVVASDERESGKRELLNFGHTFGHALEGLCGYSLPHGHFVAIGMCAAMSVSKTLGNITQKEMDGAKALLEGFSLPCRFPAECAGFTEDDVYRCMLLDKKTNNNRLKLILLKSLGEAYGIDYDDSDAVKSEIKRLITPPLD